MWLGVINAGLRENKVVCMCSAGFQECAPMLENQVVSLFRERKKEKSDSRIAHNTKCLQMFLGFAKKKEEIEEEKKFKQNYGHS